MTRQRVAEITGTAVYLISGSTSRQELHRAVAGLREALTGPDAFCAHGA
ncbi:hypothetical protein ODZ83_03670 [Acaricomes phytoseiuli]|nr:hypothetical protein [Acaricomes phytoseiuli]MCW1249296.1 hypothetical protein [Acaricomes phytoseiuli]